MKKIYNSIVFKNDVYCVVDLKSEYPALVGEYRYVIISSFSEEDLLRRFGDELKEYTPYTTAGTDYLEFINEEYSRERAEVYQDSKYLAPYTIEENTDFENVFYLFSDFVEEMKEKENTKELYSKLHRAILSIENPIVRKRIYKYYWKGKSQTEIAKEENVKQSSVNQSLRIAEKKIKEFLLNDL